MPQPNSQPAAPLSAQYIRSVAKLSRLSLSDAQVADCQSKLSATLVYMQRLAELDLANTEPLVAIGDETNRFRDDAPGPMLPNQLLINAAPQSRTPFLVVPKVME